MKVKFILTGIFKLNNPDDHIVISRAKKIGIIVVNDDEMPEVGMKYDYSVVRSNKIEA